MQQQIAEVAGVQRLQPLLIGAVELEARGRGRSRPARPPSTLSGVRPRSFQRSMTREQRPRRPLLVVDIGGLDELLQQPDLVVGIEDGEVGLQPDQLRMAGAAAAPPANGTCRATSPRPAAPMSAPTRVFISLRRLVGEGDGEDLRRIGPAGRQDVREPRGQHARLAGAGAGQHQHGAVDGLDRRALRLVQVIDVAARGSRGPLLCESASSDVIAGLYSTESMMSQPEMQSMARAALCPARRSTDIVTIWTTDASCASPGRSPIPRASAILERHRGRAGRGVPAPDPRRSHVDAGHHVRTT